MQADSSRGVLEFRPLAFRLMGAGTKTASHSCGRSCNTRLQIPAHQRLPLGVRTWPSAPCSGAPTVYTTSCQVASLTSALRSLPGRGHMCSLSLSYSKWPSWFSTYTLDRRSRTPLLGAMSHGGIARPLTGLPTQTARVLRGAESPERHPERDAESVGDTSHGVDPHPGRSLTLGAVCGISHRDAI